MHEILLKTVSGLEVLAIGNSFSEADFGKQFYRCC